METRKLKIDGMSCGSCAARVAKALKEIAGVRDVRVSLEAGAAEIDAEAGVAPEALVAAVEKKGYRAAALA